MTNFLELYAQLPNSPLRHYPLSTIKAWMKYIDLTQSPQAVMIALIERAKEEEDSITDVPVGVTLLPLTHLTTDPR